MDETDTLFPPINSVMLLRSVVVVTTLIAPAFANDRILRHVIKKITILLFIIIFFNYFLKLILMCPMRTNDKYPSQPGLVEAFVNVIVSSFSFYFNFREFSGVPSC